MSLNFSVLKKIDTKTKFIVFGFIRNYEKQSLSKHTPELVIQICLLYYYIKDEFDEECMGNKLILDKKQQTITMKILKNGYQESNSAFLTNIHESGIQSWKFKISKCGNHTGWSTTIGIYK